MYDGNMMMDVGIMGNESDGASLFADFRNDVPETDPEGVPATLEEARELYLRKIREMAIKMRDDPETNYDDADIRFSTALNLRRVREMSVCIVGCGGLGNWQWRILAGMGFRRIIVYDDDVVGLENVGPQAHSVFDIGLPKTEAVANAALAYRGVSVVQLQKRAGTLDDINHDIGFCPDIVIGCTDSAEWRNAFIASLTHLGRRRQENTPQLFLDYRMSLGDWVCFAIPMRAVIRLHEEDLLQRYCDEAVFSPEQALHEPCTERAIAYTGAHAASFTGAFLHWFCSGGREALHAEGSSYLETFFSSFDEDTSTDVPFRWKTSCSARDFIRITPSPDEGRLRRKVFGLRMENNSTLHGMASMLLRSGISVQHPWKTGPHGVVDDVSWHSRLLMRDLLRPADQEDALVIGFESEKRTIRPWLVLPDIGDGKFRVLDLLEKGMPSQTSSVDLLTWDLRGSELALSPVLVCRMRETVLPMAFWLLQLAAKAAEDPGARLILGRASQPQYSVQAWLHWLVALRLTPEGLETVHHDPASAANNWEHFSSEWWLVPKVEYIPANFLHGNGDDPVKMVPWDTVNDFLAPLNVRLSFPGGASASVEVASETTPEARDDLERVPVRSLVVGDVISLDGVEFCPVCSTEDGIVTERGSGERERLGRRIHEVWRRKAA